jgi:hypothetical protein
MHLATYLGLLHTSLGTLADAFRQVGQGHSDEADVVRTCQVLASTTRSRGCARSSTATANTARRNPNGCTRPASTAPAPEASDF